MYLLLETTVQAPHAGDRCGKPILDITLTCPERHVLVPEYLINTYVHVCSRGFTSLTLAITICHIFTI